MKISRILSASVLLACLACAFLAFPAAAQEKAEAAAPAVPSLPWSGAALIPALASADCAAELIAAGAEEPTGIALCGACSQDGCVHAEIGAICGTSGGEYKFCIYDGDICRNAGYKCNCRLGPI